MPRSQVRLSRRRAAAAIAAATGVALACPSHATNFVWDGGGTTQNWNESANWNPNGIPDPLDNVTIGLNSANVTIYESPHGQANNLTMNNGASLSVGAGGLVVGNATTLDKTTSSAVQLFVLAAVFAGVSTDTLDILHGAELDMTGGALGIHSRMDVDPQSFITGSGTISFSTTATGRAAVALSMQGNIITDGATLTFRRSFPTSTATLSFNSVGTNVSSIMVTSGTSRLSVQAPLIGAFNGVMTIGNGNTAEFTMGFAQDEDGVINMAGDASSIFSANLDVSGTAALAGTLHAKAGFSDLNASAGFGSTSKVIVDTDGILRLNQNTTYAGGSYTGAGILRQNGSAAINGITTIGPIHIYDWDGVLESTTMIINPFQHLTIDADFIDLPGGAYNGICSMDAGHLTVNTLSPWRMSGSLNLKGLVDVPTVDGQQILLAGSLFSAVPAIVNAPIRNFGGTINTTLAGIINLTGQFSSSSGATLTKSGDGTVIIHGAQAHDAGAGLKIDGGTVQMNTDPAGGSGSAGNLGVTLNPGGVLILNSPHNGLSTLTIGLGARAALTAGAGKTLITRSLLISSVVPPLGEFDVNDNAVVIDYTGGSLLSFIGSYLKLGYNGGAWNGKVIDSTAAANNLGHKTALGYAEASDVLGLSGIQTADFVGQTVDATSVLIRYTLYGDATLNGVVDFNDLVRLAQNYNTTGKRWFTADFNFDQNVDFADLVLLAQNYNTALPAEVPSSWGADFAADYAAARAGVPEPNGIFILLPALAALRSRRGR